MEIWEHIKAENSATKVKCIPEDMKGHLHPLLPQQLLLAEFVDFPCIYCALSCYGLLCHRRSNA
jgi:hypothetical protein